MKACWVCGCRDGVKEHQHPTGTICPAVGVLQKLSQIVGELTLICLKCLEHTQNNKAEYLTFCRFPQKHKYQQ